MPSTLKRKGSPGITESEESSKRRFAENDTATGEAAEEEPTAAAAAAAAEGIKHEDDAQNHSATTSTAPAQSPDAAPASSSSSFQPPTDSRLARFAALRARNASSRKANLAETKHEAKRASIDPSQLTSLQRKKDVAQHKLLKAEIEAGGEDFERKRAWDWTVEESEAWDARLAEKKAARERNMFQDYNQEAGKVYERQVGLMQKGEGGGMEERVRQYEVEKREAIDRAVRSGGLEVVETAEGELIAVDKDGSFYSTAEGFAESKPSRAAVDRLVGDIKKAEEMRLKKRRERGRADEDAGDVTYINEKNKQFNMKLARFYNKYTADIRESFERGTAI